MNTVFMVTCDEPENFRVIDVFSNHEAASEFAEKYKKDNDWCMDWISVEEWRLKEKSTDENPACYHSHLTVYKNNDEKISRSVSYTGYVNPTPDIYVTRTVLFKVIFASSYVSQEDADRLVYEERNKLK